MEFAVGLAVVAVSIGVLIVANVVLRMRYASPAIRALFHLETVWDGAVTNLSQYSRAVRGGALLSEEEKRDASEALDDLLECMSALGITPQLRVGVRDFVAAYRAALSSGDRTRFEALRAQWRELVPYVRELNRSIWWARWFWWVPSVAGGVPRGERL